MPRRFFFGTNTDLAPGLRAVEYADAVDFVQDEMRDDRIFTVVRTLSAHSGLGRTGGRDVNTSPRYLIFPRGKIPKPRGIRQRRGGLKYVVDPTPDCLILICGGLHAASGALLAGELQRPLDASRSAVELFRRVSRKLFQGFTRVQRYWVGPEALQGLRAGQRLVTISLGSPLEYDLAEPERSA